MNRLFETYSDRMSGLERRYDPSVLPIDEVVISRAATLYWNWLREHDRDFHASPVQHPDIVLAELENLKRHSSLQPFVVRDTSENHNDAYAILVPKTIRTSQIGGVGTDRQLHGLQLVGSRILGLHKTVEQQRRILNAALQHASESNADFILIEDLIESTSLYEAVQGQKATGSLLFVSHDFQPRHFIDLPAGFGEYMNRFSSHSRKLLRRALNKCAGAKLTRISEVDQIPGFLAAAHEISKRSWQTHRYGMRIRNDERELRTLTSSAKLGFLRSYLFSINDVPTAFAIASQRSGVFRYEETAFRADFRQYSPGKTMLHQIISDLYDHNPAESFDFGFGDADYKQHFSNRESRSGGVWLVPPTLKARLSLTYLNVCRQFRSAVYTRVKDTQFGQIARKWLRSVPDSPIPTPNRDWSADGSRQLQAPALD